MIAYHEALENIFKLAKQCPLLTEEVPLELADGRVCSRDIESPEAVPSFNNSAMDGFALNSADTKGASKENPIRLAVMSIIAAGDKIKTYPSSSRAIEIMTGAPLPDIFDAVVKIEDVEVTLNSDGKTLEILVSEFVPVKNNVREKGSDYKIGQTVLTKGSQIRAESMMALASLGVSVVPVYTKPLVTILSTGKELVPLQTTPLQPGMIRNSTAIYLKTALTHLGVEVARTKTIGDEVEGFKTCVKEIIEQDTDVLITTGAVSMGKYDFIVPALKDLGAEIIFHKVAIRPGKPLLFAKINRAGRNPLVVFGVPGNPVSSAVGFRFFLTPFFRELNGQKPEQGLQMKLSESSPKPEGLKCFFKAKLENSANGIRVRSLTGQASYMVSPLVAANAWVLFSEDGTQVSKDEDVLVYPLLPDQAFEIGGAI